MKHLIKAHFANLDGTNDLEIVDGETGEVVEFLPEALVVDIFDEFEYIDLELALASIGINEVDDGSKVEMVLKNYFNF